MINLADVADWSCGRMVLLARDRLSSSPLSGNILTTLECRMFATANKCHIPHSFDTIDFILRSFDCRLVVTVFLRISLELFQNVLPSI